MTTDNQLTDVLAQLVTKMGDAAEKYVPQAISLAGKYGQDKAIIDLITCIPGFGIAAFLIWLGCKQKEPEDQDSWDVPVWAILKCIFWLGGGLFSLCSTLTLLNSDIWLSALNSNFALVHMVTDK